MTQNKKEAQADGQKSELIEELINTIMDDLSMVGLCKVHSFLNEKNIQGRRRVENEIVQREEMYESGRW